MATLELYGFDGLQDALERIGEIPFDVTSEALNGMAEVAMDKIRSTGEAMGVRDPESDVHILDTIKVNKPKLNEDGGYCTITFSGTRPGGRKRVRNAEIAFINEYGKEGQPARPFIRQAGEQYGDQISEPGEKIVGDWMVETFNEA